MPYPGYTGWLVQLDPAAVAVGRTMLDINNPTTGIQVGGTSSGQGINWGVAQDSPQFAQEGEWGSTAADTRWDNRTVTIPLGLGMGGPGTPDANTALANLRSKVGLFQREGGWLLRQRAGQPALYADIVDAQLDVPDTWGETGGMEPGVTLTLITRPDWYGDEIALDSIPCTGYCAAVLTSGGSQAVIKGDYPARCRLQVTDTSGNNQFSVFWGLRSRYYDPTNALFYKATDLTAGVGTTSVTLSGAYSATQIKSPTLPNAWPTNQQNLVAMGPASGPFTHAGAYRVWARIYSTTTNAQVALYWCNGTQAMVNWTQNTPAAVSQLTNTWAILDLGVINLQAPPLGNQQWSGGLSAMSPAGTGNVTFDCLWLQPLPEKAGSLQINPVVDSNPATPIVGNVDSAELRSEGLYTIFYRGSNSYTYLASLGDLPRLPPSELEARPVQLLLKMSRNQFAVSDLGIDTFTVQPFYRPSFMFRP